MAAPTVIRWNSSDGDFDAGTSWEGGVAPAVDQVALFPSTNMVAPTISPAGLTTIGLNAFITERGFTPNLGGVGAPIEICANKVYHMGSGTLHYKDGTGAGGNTVTDYVLIDSDNLVSAAQLDGTSITRIHVAKGKVTLLGSIAAVSVLELSYRDSPATDAVVVCTSGGGAITSVLMGAGNLTTAQAVTTGIMKSGIWTHTGTSAITTITQCGGTVYYNASTAPTTGNIMGGVFDMRQNKNGFDFATFPFKIYPGAKFLYNPDLVTMPAGGVPIFS